MHRSLPCLVVFVLGALATPAHAQVAVDTVFAWQGYARTARCHVRIYNAPPGDEDRSHTVVVREMAENEGPSTIDDARHLVERIGRAFGIDPVDAYWIFHWGAFSFVGAGTDTRKQLFLRATFRRTKSQSLGTPYWKVVSREEVEDYTDRQFR